MKHKMLLALGNNSKRLNGSAVNRGAAFLSSQRLIHIRDLFFTLVARDMKLRYKRSILGIACPFSPR
jgi:hypothetical protein